MYGEQENQRLFLEAQYLLRLNGGVWQVKRYADKVSRSAQRAKAAHSSYLPLNTVSRPIQVHGQSQLPLL